MLPLMNLWNTVWLPRSDDRRLTDTVRCSGGLELNVLLKLKNMDLEKLDQILNDDLNFKQLPQTAFVRADARKPLRMAQYARSRVLRNPTVGQLVRFFRRSKGGVDGGRDRGLDGKMVLFGPARVLAVEQPTEVESQVAAVVWLAHGGSLIRAAPEHSGSLLTAGYHIV